MSHFYKNINQDVGKAEDQSFYYIWRSWLYNPEQDDALMFLPSSYVSLLDENKMPKNTTIPNVDSHLLWPNCALLWEYINQDAGKVEDQSCHFKCNPMMKIPVDNL